MTVIRISDILTKKDINRIHEIHTITEERSKNGWRTFTVELPIDIHEKLSARFGIELATQVPFRWLRGDVPPHTDRAHDGREFTYTYLIYLSNSSGYIRIGMDEYTIRAGDAYCFSEGTVHGAFGTTERLIMGPFNECSVPVGYSGVYYTDDPAYFSQEVTSGFLLSIQQINTIGGGGTPFPTDKELSGWSYSAEFSYGTNLINGRTPRDGEVFPVGSPFSTTGGIYLSASFGNALIVVCDNINIQLVDGKVIPAENISQCELIEKIGVRRDYVITNEFFYQRSRANNTIPSRNGFATR